MQTEHRYRADHVFALGAVYFYLAIITIFMVIHVLARISTPQMRSLPFVRRFVAGFRYISYKSYNITAIRWFSPSIGVLILLFSGLLFFTSKVLSFESRLFFTLISIVMTFVPKPYYWPNEMTKDNGNAPPLSTRTGWMALALLPLIMCDARVDTSLVSSLIEYSGCWDLKLIS
jgi:hypothetical protein